MSEKLDRARSADERNAAAYAAALRVVSDAKHAVGCLRLEASNAGTVSQILMAMRPSELQALTRDAVQVLHLSSGQSKDKLGRVLPGAAPVRGPAAVTVMSARLAQMVDSDMRAIERVLAAERALAAATAHATEAATRRRESARYLQALTAATQNHRVTA